MDTDELPENPVTELGKEIGENEGNELELDPEMEEKVAEDPTPDVLQEIMEEAGIGEDELKDFENNEADVDGVDEALEELENIVNEGTDGEANPLDNLGDDLNDVLEADNENPLGEALKDLGEQSAENVDEALGDIEKDLENIENDGTEGTDPLQEAMEEAGLEGELEGLEAEAEDNIFDDELKEAMEELETSEAENNPL